jgi:DNA replication protein DnaC
MENINTDQAGTSGPNSLGEAIAKRIATLRELTPEEVAQREAADAERESQERIRHRRKLLAEFLVSVGNLHSSCRLANYECRSPQQKKVFEAVSEYADTMPERLDNREGIVLFGPVGTGKDHLAVALGGRAVEKYGHRVRWLNGQDWFGQVRDAIDGDLAERTLMAEISLPDILILSDPVPPIGNLTQHQATMLYRLFEARDARGRVTWVTINVMDDKEADERLGVPTWDRICDRSWKMFCNWKSHRKPAKVIT